MNSASNSSIALIEAGLKRRHRAERRFQLFGIGALAFAGLMLCLLMATIIGPGISGFTRHEIRLEIDTAPFETILRDTPENMDFYLHTQAMLRSAANPAPSTQAERHML